jgi:hypothetical protein
VYSAQLADPVGIELTAGGGNAEEGGGAGAAPKLVAGRVGPVAANEHRRTQGAGLVDMLEDDGQHVA